MSRGDDVQGTRDPAVERRANRMLIAVLAFVGALLVVRGWIGTEVGEGEAARRVHGYGLVYVERSEQAFVRAPAVPGTDGTPAQVAWVAPAAGQAPEIAWTDWKESTATEWAAATMKDSTQESIVVSWPRTAGVWIGALLTLAVLSFLWRDNPVYKLAEAIVVGVSAGYWMIVAVWDTLVPKLVGPLAPGFTASALLPAFDAGSLGRMDVAGALIALVLGAMLLSRLSSKVGWLGIFPLAYIVGTFAGLKFVEVVNADLVAQVATMAQPLIVVQHLPGDPATAAIDWPATVGASLSAILVFVGVLSVLAYFFFSAEHKGALGRTAKVGIWYLMITFGASFGFTVMGRIALLAARFEFLFDDWLWVIDPTKRH
jgi:hypothetical protein